MRTATVVAAVLTTTVVLVIALATTPAYAQVPVKGYCQFPGEPSLCSPSLPGIALPIELDQVRIAAFNLRREGGSWFVDLTLATDRHPGKVTVDIWRDNRTSHATWESSPGQPSTVSYTLAAGPANAQAHGLSVEWEVNGKVWHRWTGLHYGGPGSFHHAAGKNTVLPWWLRP